MPGLQGTVKIPGMGNVEKKYVAVAGGAVVVIVGIGFYRKRQANQAAAAATGVLPADSSLDTTPIGPGGDNGLTNQFGDPVAPPIVQQQPGINTNLDWLETGAGLNLGGTDENVIRTALANILGGTPVTQAQVEIFHEVVGIIGGPPQGNPTIKMTSSSPATTTPPPKTSPVYKMIWGPVTVTGSYVGMTLGALQDKYARDAGALGATKLSTAVLADYRRQAAIRNVMSTRTVLRNGQVVSLRRAVKA